MKKIFFSLLLACCWFLPESFSQNLTKPDGKNIPYFGVDTAGAHLSRNKAYGKEGWYYPAFEKALKELNVDFLMDHYYELQSARRDANNKQNSVKKLTDLSAFLQKNNISYIWNLEKANWTETFEYEKGKNFFEPEPGLHYFKAPPEIMEMFKKDSYLQNVCYDEIDHMQLTNNKFINDEKTGDIPALVNTTGMDFIQAYEAIYKKTKLLSDYYAQYDVKCEAEMVWPVMHHIFAKAGWIISPKLLKESFNPVPIAMALGAAIEYEASGCDIDFNPDLWFCSHYPGHSVDSLKSALIAAHWLGATKIYVENLDYINIKKTIHQPDKAKDFDYSSAEQGDHHPDAEGIKGSLVSYLDANNVKLTKYGEIAKWYSGEYRYSHPREYTWRDARCKIAIVRFPDSCWGQKGTFFGDTLLGAKNLHSNETTEAWFKIWNMLTDNTIPDTGISFHIPQVREAVRAGGVGKDNKWGPRFFCPIPPVLVFDHRIGDEQPEFDFRGAEVIFLTGVNVTPATQHLLQQQVSAGKVCISLPELAPNEVKSKYDSKSGKAKVVKSGSGKWILTSNFSDAAVKQVIKPYLPPNDEMQYLFKNKSIIFKKIDKDSDEIKVIVTEINQEKP
ncbi:MAG: hypothetical protein ABFD79_17050 [Phycisphaerales bacterium]